MTHSPFILQADLPSLRPPRPQASLPPPLPPSLPPLLYLAASTDVTLMIMISFNAPAWAALRLARAPAACGPRARLPSPSTLSPSRPLSRDFLAPAAGKGRSMPVTSLTLRERWGGGPRGREGGREGREGERLEEIKDESEERERRGGEVGGGGSERASDQSERETREKKTSERETRERERKGPERTRDQRERERQ